MPVNTVNQSFVVGPLETNKRVLIDCASDCSVSLFASMLGTVYGVPRVSVTLNATSPSPNPVYFQDSINIPNIVDQSAFVGTVNAGPNQQIEIHPVDVSGVQLWVSAICFDGSVINITPQPH